MEAVLIEVRQNDYTLNSRSGYNRCLIPRLSVSVGDRVQEEVVKRNEYDETEVDNMFARGRNKKKVRQRNDDDEKEAETPATASNAQPPPIKRRKYKFKRSPLAQENSTVQQDSSLMPEEREKSETERKECLGQNKERCQQGLINVDHDKRKEGSASNSEKKCFPIFNRSTENSGIAEREKVVSRKKQVKISPPTFKCNKISDHFKPKPRRPNEPKDEDKRGPGS